MSEKTVMIASFDDLEDANDTKFDTVEAYGKTLQIGSLSSGDMLDWLEANEDAKERKVAGLRLLVKSLVDKDGKRIPADKFEHWVGVFKNKNAASNGKVIAAALKLNGLDRAAKKFEELKNGSAEANTGGSPSGSPSQPAA